MNVQRDSVLRHLVFCSLRGNVFTPARSALGPRAWGGPRDAQGRTALRASTESASRCRFLAKPSAVQLTFTEQFK
eukprot:6073317-Karenia_brevis.AAC.1